MRRSRLQVPLLEPLRLVLWAPLLSALIGLAILFGRGIASPFYVGLLVLVIVFDVLGLFGPAWLRARLREQFPVAYLLVLLSAWTASFYLLPDHPASPMVRLAALMHATTLYVFLFGRRSPLVAEC
ncbi:hypothetical protein [Deinococcus sp. NW-56]|uniref:hypothetical protein n=1 Tax=Deinococcus sp. NW-56 TaxID=2080419 RepID=UPI000CF3B67C|nr:hypothetical protein [Deinococcus sp. NW-56]